MSQEYLQRQLNHEAHLESMRTRAEERARESRAEDESLNNLVNASLDKLNAQHDQVNLIIKNVNGIIDKVNGAITVAGSQMLLASASAIAAAMFASQY